MSRIDVQKVAALSRLHLTPEELAAIGPQIEAILDYVERLGEVNTDGVEVMAHAVERTNVLREDIETPMFSAAEALAGAPQTDGQYFLVPQIVDAG